MTKILDLIFPQLYIILARSCNIFFRRSIFHMPVRDRVTGKCCRKVSHKSDVIVTESNVSINIQPLVYIVFVLIRKIDRHSVCHRDIGHLFHHTVIDRRFQFRGFFRVQRLHFIGQIIEIHGIVKRIFAYFTK